MSKLIEPEHERAFMDSEKVAKNWVGKPTKQIKSIPKEVYAVYEAKKHSER